MDNSIQNLLDQIRIISQKHREKRNERRERGEDFNIFSDFGLMSDEVRLHSAFIAALLNPKGTHGQKDKFMKAFIEMLARTSNSIPIDFLETDSPNLSVQVEKSVGPLTSENGGRIDLYITDRHHRIILENKIYADDQHHQMKRYWNFGMQKGGEESFRLIYLTLDGNNPGADSTDGLKNSQYTCLSYKYDIMQWLQRCLELSSSLPLVRETIIQYINTIKILTNNNMEKNDDLLQVICREENIDAVFDIFNSRDALFNHIMNQIFIPKLKILAIEKGFQLKTGVHDWVGTSWAGGSFFRDDWKYLKLSFEFERRGLGNLIFGFQTNREYKSTDIKDWEELQNRFQCKNRNHQTWIWKNFEGDTYWDNKQSVKNILSGKTLNDFSAMIDFAVECTHGLEV